MASAVLLKLLDSVQKAKTFQARVTIEGAAPGSEVTVTLEQKRGAEPFIELLTLVAAVDSAGQAIALFDIQLSGPATVVLVASARDSTGRYYRPDAGSIEVEG